MSATLHDPALALASVLGIGVLLLLVGRVGRSARVAPESLRRWLHAAVGTATLAVIPLFHEQAWALAPPVLFLGVNVSPQGRRWLISTVSDRQGARGLWTFPLGVALTVLFSWEEVDRSAILAGVAVLAYSDPLAAVVGSRWGQRTLQPVGRGRTLEGSLAFFASSVALVGIISALAHGGIFPWRMGIACGLAGTVAEAVAPSGWDNLVIPVVVAATYGALS